MNIFDRKMIIARLYCILFCHYVIVDFLFKIKAFQKPKLIAMKKFILIISFISVFIACSKKATNPAPEYVYTDSKGTNLVINSSIWFTTLHENSEGGFWNLHLLLSGYTNADRVSVTTYGDGLIDSEDLKLDSKKNFDQDTINIAFLHYTTTPPSGEFETGTTISIYKGSDTLVVYMKSGKMNY